MRHLVLLAAFACLNGCGGGSSGDNPPSAAPPTHTPDLYQPAPGTSWHVQLTGTLQTEPKADLFILDLFDTPASTIAELQRRGTRVICYFSAGSHEDWRPDADEFPAEALGNALSGWPGEHWLDIRHSGVMEVLRRRLDLAVSKGCDGVDPDNMDGYTNDPGFPLTANDQRHFNRQLATAAHGKGLAVGLKNDLGQIAELVDYFDFAVNEQCHVYDECDLLAPFITANKAVFNIEYEQEYVDDAGARATLCADAATRRFSTLILPHDLDGSF